MDKVTEEDLTAECKPIYVHHLNKKISLPPDDAKLYSSKDRTDQLNAMGDKSITFLRQFRFTADSKTSPSLVSFTKSAAYSLKPKEFKIEYHDVSIPDYDGNLVNPIRKYINEMLMDKVDYFVFTNYDGCGNVLGKIEFDRCRLIEHRAVQNYSDSDILTHSLTFYYEYAKMR